MIRRLLAAALVAFAEWSLVITPTQAAINAPVTSAQLPADVGDVARPAGSNTTTITAGAAVKNIGYTPVNKAGDTILGALAVTGKLSGNKNVLDDGNGNVTITGNASVTGNTTFVGAVQPGYFAMGPAPFFQNYNNAKVSQFGPQIDLVQNNSSANYNYLSPQLNLERYDNSTDGSQYNNWGASNLSAQLLISTDVGPAGANNPNGLAIRIRNQNAAIASSTNANESANPLVAASFFADAEPPSGKLANDVFSINTIVGTGQGALPPINAVGVENDIGVAQDSTLALPGSSATSSNFTGFWAQAAGFNNSANKGTAQTAGLMVTGAYPGSSWNLGVYANTNFRMWGAYIYNQLNASGANGLYVHNTWGAATSSVVDFGNGANSFLLIGGDGSVSLGNAAVTNVPVSIAASIKAKGHFGSNGPAPTAATSAGSLAYGTLTDTHGTISASAASTVTITFATAYAASPDCTVAPDNGPIPSVATSATKLTVTTTAGEYFTYHCMGS